MFHSRVYLLKYLKSIPSVKSPQPTAPNRTFKKMTPSGFFSSAGNEGFVEGKKALSVGSLQPRGPVLFHYWCAMKWKLWRPQAAKYQAPEAAKPEQPVRPAIKIAFAIAVLLFVAASWPAPTPPPELTDSPGREHVEHEKAGRRQPRPLVGKVITHAQIAERRAYILFGVLATYRLLIIVLLLLMGRPVSITTHVLFLGLGGAMAGASLLLGWNFGLALSIYIVILAHTVEIVRLTCTIASQKST